MKNTEDRTITFEEALEMKWEKLSETVWSEKINSQLV